MGTDAPLPAPEAPEAPETPFFVQATTGFYLTNGDTVDLDPTYHAVPADVTVEQARLNLLGQVVKALDDALAARTFCANPAWKHKDVSVIINPAHVMTVGLAVVGVMVVQSEPSQPPTSDGLHANSAEET